MGAGASSETGQSYTQVFRFTHYGLLIPRVEAYLNLRCGTFCREQSR